MSIRLLIGFGMVLLLGSGELWALSDPTRPAPWVPQQKSTAPKKAVKTQLTLMAILHSEGRQVAVINGRSLQAGDRIEGYRVEAIAVDHAILRSAKGVRRLELKKRTVKSKPAPAGQ